MPKNRQYLNDADSNGVTDHFFPYPVIIVITKQNTVAHAAILPLFPFPYIF